MRKPAVFLASALILVAVQMYAQQDQRWRYIKDDVKTRKHIVEIDAKSFERTDDAQTFRLHGMTARLYDAGGSAYKQIASQEAIINEKTGTLTYGPRLDSFINLRAPTVR